MTVKVRPFLIHLRLHYQFFILSAPYLFGGLLAGQIDWPRFLGQFLNVHILLFGGATAYNSFFDKDEGPIGGLRNPPKMQGWMHGAALAMQFAGLALAATTGPEFALAYAGSMLLFWLYSTPHARWKGRPLLSFVAIGLSSGTFALLMGRLAASGAPLTWPDWIAAGGAGAMLLSLYPVSQLYQLDEDRRRADRTFALEYGRSGIRKAFLLFFRIGVVALLVAMAAEKPWWMPAALGVAAPGLGVFLWGKLKALHGVPEEYGAIMRLKYGTSILFVLVITFGMVLERL